MGDAASMKERHEAGLAELAELGLSLARDLHARALAAADDKAAGDLALAFHRVSRSVRQTYALESRLERERRLAEREVRDQVARETLTRVQKKRDKVRRAVGALIWSEAEGDEAEELFESLEALVWDQSEDHDAYLETPVEACIERIRTGLGLAAPANGDDPPPDAPPDVVIWKSSG